MWLIDKLLLMAFSPGAFYKLISLMPKEAENKGKSEIYKVPGEASS